MRANEEAPFHAPFLSNRMLLLVSGLPGAEVGDTPAWIDHLLERSYT